MMMMMMMIMMQYLEDKVVDGNIDCVCMETI